MIWLTLNFSGLLEESLGFDIDYRSLIPPHTHTMAAQLPFNLSCLRHFCLDGEFLEIVIPPPQLA